VGGMTNLDEFQFPVDRDDKVEIRLVDQYGTRLGDLSSAALGDVSKTRNDAGTADIAFNSADKKSSLVLLEETEVQIVDWSALHEDGSPEVWWGLVTGEERGPGYVRYALTEWFIILKDRLLHDNKDYVDTDQFDIAWDLLEYAQTGIDMDLNIHADFIASEYHRERHWTGDQYAVIWDLLYDFAHIQNGFDIRWDYDLTGEKLWVPVYPQDGDVSEVVLQWKYNVSGYTIGKSGPIKNKFWSTGGFNVDTTSKLVGYAQDVASMGQYRARESSGALGVTESSQEWLDDAAAQEVASNKLPRSTLEIEAWEGSMNDEEQERPPIYGKVRPGDWVKVIIDDGETQINDLFSLLTITRIDTNKRKLEFALR
jgi:hypothetical protein